jgi:hypothetical protein
MLGSSVWPARDVGFNGQGWAKVYRDTRGKDDPYNRRQQTVLADTHRSYRVEYPLIRCKTVLLLNFWKECIDSRIQRS